ncbi:hypothetical protein B0H10DRAFT_2438956 [Mycena sp. CBHHK59/15]|nr:hypothetical protein B0H10DRAFT_2438956 [Mycena sp. CBHHK59/15]
MDGADSDRADFIRDVKIARLSTAAARAIRGPTAPAPAPPPPSTAEDYLYTLDYDADGQHPTPGEPIAVTVLRPKEFLPHPKYQFCTPASRSVTARMIDNKSAPFIPYADDPAFVRPPAIPMYDYDGEENPALVDAYLDAFESFQWQVDLKDPDDEVIQFETVRRLHIDHGLSAERIDSITSTFTHFRELRSSNESGLLWDVSQRDLPEVIWGDGLPSSSKPQLPHGFAVDAIHPDDIFEHINRGLPTFCPNLNCILHECGVHIAPDWECFTPPLKPKAPVFKSAHLYKRVKLQDACGEQCFLFTKPNLATLDIDPEQDFTFLHGMLKLDPDVRPCDLAIICNLPCRQTFLYRIKHFVNDRDIEKAKPRKRGKAKEQPPEYVGRDLPLIPCSHSGACSARSGCVCFGSKVACTRNCQCPLTCSRRWPGCNGSCRSRNRKCADDRCYCRQAGRECDPDLCTTCDARGKRIHHPRRNSRETPRCQNMVIQRGEFKRFDVKSAQHGLGAFAAEDIKAGEAIGEYTGELINEKEEGLHHRTIIHDHSGVNYCFGLEAEKDKSAITTVDAHRIGNPTRFLNDSMPEEPNCVALEHQVNGETRLVIFAVEDVKKGEELFLSYGDGYWQFHGNKNGGDEE